MTSSMYLVREEVFTNPAKTISIDVVCQALPNIKRRLVFAYLSKLARIGNLERIQKGIYKVIDRTVKKSTVYVKSKPVISSRSKILNLMKQWQGEFITTNDVIKQFPDIKKATIRNYLSKEFKRENPIPFTEGRRIPGKPGVSYKIINRDKISEIPAEVIAEVQSKKVPEKLTITDLLQMDMHVEDLGNIVYNYMRKLQSEIQKLQYNFDENMKVKNSQIQDLKSTVKNLEKANQELRDINSKLVNRCKAMNNTFKLEEMHIP